ncbi:hypothetical protein [Actinoplanes sp. NPDC049681]|uniref:hypothetical protein n=1 Tax=Actinoplanes sp. NPDC049681 TaxID=3363905 RepID=UPI0037BBD4E1
MTAGGRSTSETVDMVVRVGGGIGIACVGSWVAIGMFLLMNLEIHPIEGQGSTRLAIIFGLAMAVAIVAPMVGWWFLVPRARWWGIPVCGLVTAGFFGVSLISFTR